MATYDSLSSAVSALATRVGEEFVTVREEIPSDYVSSLSVSGTTVTYNKADGTSGTITTQDKKVYQYVTTTAAEYPVLATYTADLSSNSTTYARFASGVTLNPSTGTITATTFSGDLSGNATTATTATTATYDASGNIIADTYATKNEVEAVSEAAAAAQTAADSAVAALSGVYTYQGSVDTTDALPTTADVGDVYNVAEDGMNYAWTGTEWDALGGVQTTVETANKLGSSTVGGTAKPIYLSSGTATACSSTVGGIAKPVYMKSGTITVCSDTVGDASTPVYMSSGTITACTSVTANSATTAETLGSSTVGGTAKPIYLNLGTATALSDTVGSISTPVYLEAGTITACTSVPTTSDVITGLSVSGTTITYTYGDGTTGTITTQDNNTDTKVTQTVTTTAAEYPILACATANATSSSTTTARFGKGITLNPSTSAITATSFIGDLTGNADTATSATSATTATSATQDGDGNVIADTYATKTELENAIVDEMTGASVSAAGSSGLVPAPSAGDNMAMLYGDGAWKNYASRITVNNSSSGLYVKMAEIVISGTYTDAPIEFVFSRRSDPTPTRVSIQFKNENSTDPSLKYLTCMGYTNYVYLYKADTSTWYLYIKSSVTYDSITVLEYYKSPHEVKVAVTWASSAETIDTLPDEYTQAEFGYIVGKLGSSTVGGTAKPIYLSSGTATECSSTVGTTDTPVFMSSGTITVCTGVATASDLDTLSDSVGDTTVDFVSLFEAAIAGTTSA